MATEGRTRFFPAFDGHHRGPKAREADAAFYNPAMRPNRDLSVLLVQAESKRRGRALDVGDVLSGTGVRSLRLAHEAGANVWANDADPKAAAAIQEGIEAHGLTTVHPIQGDAHAFLASRRFDVVDVDPYGSPAPFLDGAVRATRHGGLVCLTATDTAALSGRYPRVCRRRYGAEHHLHPEPWRSEVGLRILAGAVIRAAGRLDRAATPVLSVFGGHWMRVVLRVEDGKAKADDRHRKLRWVEVAEDAPVWGSDGSGPMWSGPLHDAGLLADMVPDAGTAPATSRLLALLLQEAHAPPFWIDPGRLRRHADREHPGRDVLIQRLRDAGFVATRTHLDPQGIRTDAPRAACIDAWET